MATAPVSTSSTTALTPASNTNLRVKTLEIRWHDSKPISSCDFQPRKRVRLTSEKDAPTISKPAAQGVGESYKLATGGEDNNVRIWAVHPNFLPPSIRDEASNAAEPAATPIPHPPKIEYLSTLSRHTAAVNVVRWSPNGELVASAGDDGMIIIWANSPTPSVTFGSEANEDAQYDKEHWKPRISFHCTTMQVYDLAWSPTGEYIIAGSTDNTARIFTAADGKCIRELAEHTHFVQGVAWDPMNEFIATQSSDRSVHVHSVSGSVRAGQQFEVHAVGKNTRINVKHPHTHTRAPSVGATSSTGVRASSRPRFMRRGSTASDAESAITSMSEREIREESLSALHTHGLPSRDAAPLTPAASVASTPYITTVTMPPPTVERGRTSSRRSSFSSQAPESPATQYSNRDRMARSPSPMPPLPAIRSAPAPAVAASAFSNFKLYGDENFTNFFRRLTFSPDGGLLLTPAGHFEDPAVQTQRGRKREKEKDGSFTDPASASSVYIYSRMNFSRPPIGQIPGFKKPSVAVKFSPVLYELRPGVIGESGKEKDVASVVVEPGREDSVMADLNGPSNGAFQLPTSQSAYDPASAMSSPAKSMTSPSPSVLQTPVSTTAPLPPLPASVTPLATPISTPAPLLPLTPTSSVYALPYRMLFAVATMDTITIHDTQQAGPICLFTKLHYDEFTDMAWTPDGQCLLLSSRDGYCTIVVMDELLKQHATQQPALQIQSIAHSHGADTRLPSASQTSAVLPFPTPSPTPSVPKRQLSPTPTEEGPGVSTLVEGLPPAPAPTPVVNKTKPEEPSKKKRRVELTKVADLA